MVETEDAMAETEEAWPEDEDESWPNDEGEEADGEEPGLAEEPRRDVVKGEPQKDEVDDAFGVEPVTTAKDAEGTRGVADITKEEQEEGGEMERNLFHDDEDDAGAAEVPKEAPKVVKEQLQEMPSYEPTSPADDFEGAHDSRGLDPMATEALQTSERPGRGRRPERKAPQGPPAQRQREEKVIPCPVLLVGSQFTKECLLKADRWVQVGRQPQANILLQNKAISKHHCKLEWRRGCSSVDLRMLDGVTHVNDRRLGIGAATSVKHGDLIRIHGKGVCFRFLVDMNPSRPISEQLPDIRSMPNFIAATKEAQHSSRTPEEELNRKVRKMRALAAAARENAMKYEQRLTELQTQRSLRFQKLQEEMEKCSWFAKDEQRLEEVLISSRDDWMERLQQQTIALEKFAAPLNEQTRETQLKRNQIEVLAKEEDRRLHPERHLASLPEPSPRKEIIKEITEGAPGTDLIAKLDEADGEEEAFPDAPARGLGLKDEDKPTVEVLKTMPTGADDDIANLFGDFDSEEETLEQGYKRQRVA